MTSPPAALAEARGLELRRGTHLAVAASDHHDASSSSGAPGTLASADAPAPARVGLLGRMFQGWGRKG